MSILENILDILVTFEVSSPEKLILVNILQPENILFISSTLLVLKCERSRLVILPSPESMLDILVAFEVSR